MPRQKEPLLKLVETREGDVNVIIDGKWAAFFSKSEKEQLTFLVDKANESR